VRTGDVNDRALAPSRFLTQLVLALAVTCTPAFLAPTRASAQETPATTAPAATTKPSAAGTQVTGTLTVEQDGSEAGVAGVTITVESPDGSEAGRASTGDDGSWTVPLPAAGRYVVRIDPGSLPDGVFLAQPDETSRDVGVAEGRSRPILFGLTAQAGGEQQAGTGGVTLERVAELVIDGVRFGLILAIASMGLSLIYGVTGLINFAHGELVTLGAFLAWEMNDSSLHLTLVLAALVSVVLMGAVGGGLERYLFRPMRRRRVSNISLIVVTIGLGELLRAVVQFGYGNNPFSYRDYAIQQTVPVGPVSILPKSAAIIAISVAVLVGVALMLQRTRLGTAMRAVADNKDLASSSGIDVSRVILHTWILGTALAALGGIMLAVDTKVKYDLGFNALLLMFAAVVVGGLGTAYGPVVGALLIGVVTQVSTLWFDTEFKFVFALLALVLMLLFRPQGILGRRQRVG